MCSNLFHNLKVFETLALSTMSKSGFKRARRREMVSLPTEKTRSTATAEREPNGLSFTLPEKLNKPTGNGHNITCKLIQTRVFGRNRARQGSRMHTRNEMMAERDNRLR
jgi:hypothetical protein